MVARTNKNRREVGKVHESKVIVFPLLQSSCDCDENAESRTTVSQKKKVVCKA